MDKDTYIKFGMHAPRQSPDMTPENEKGGDQGHVTPYLAEICTLTSAFYTIVS